MAADEAKSKGDAAFNATDYTGAVKHFSDAISLSPAPNHILFSNRSCTYSMRSQYTRALRDAEQLLLLKPEWAKSYYRLGVAQVGLHNFDEAVVSFKKGLEINPNNDGLLSALFAAEKAAACAAAEKASGIAIRSGPFCGPEMWTELEADWRSRELLKQKDFVKKLKKLQRNLKLLDLKDERFACAVGVIITAKLRRATFGDDEDQRDMPPRETEGDGADESKDIMDEADESKVFVDGADEGKVTFSLTELLEEVGDGADESEVCASFKENVKITEGQQ